MLSDFAKRLAVALDFAMDNRIVALKLSSFYSDSAIVNLTWLLTIRKVVSWGGECDVVSAHLKAATKTATLT